jgi:hypothetical protein
MFIFTHMGDVNKEIFVLPSQSPMALDTLYTIGEKRRALGSYLPSIADTHPFTPHTTTALPILPRDIPILSHYRFCNNKNKKKKQ